MKISSNIQFKYTSEKMAEMIYESLEVDNKDYVKSQKTDEKINYYYESEKLGSFITTIDDLIACEIVAEKMVTTNNI